MHIVPRAFVIAAAAACAAATATAQPYPSRSINMIVSAPAAGMTDTMAHAMQNELSRVLGQPMNLTNQDAFAGTLGITDLTHAAPDGYTIAFTSNNPLSAQPHVQKVRYDLASFRYLCLAYHTPLVLVGGLQTPFKTAEEFAAFARAKPENLVYGYPGLASQQHLGMLAVLNAMGANARAIPFNGPAATLRALFDGAVMAIIETPAASTATDFPVLAALSDERIGTLPNLRTMKELGYPATAFLAGGLIAPAGIADAAADRLEKACAEAVASPAYKTIAARLNIEPRYLPGDGFRKLIEAESAANAQIIARAGLSAAK